jgi:hypothetical protein
LCAKTNGKIHLVIFCFLQIESNFLKIRFYDPINRLFWNLIGDQLSFLQNVSFLC